MTGRASSEGSSSSPRSRLRMPPRRSRFRSAERALSGGLLRRGWDQSHRSLGQSHAEGLTVLSGKLEPDRHQKNRREVRIAGIGEEGQAIKAADQGGGLAGKQVGGSTPCLLAKGLGYRPGLQHPHLPFL